MKKYASVQYKKAAVVVHGKSERILASYIYTNLHLPFFIIDRKKGGSSIQINGLKKMLNKEPYNNPRSFAEKYSIEYDKKERKLKNFKLFIIMDTDDCTDEVKNDYISGRLFEDSCLRDYIVPIFNTPNLETVMMKAGIMTKRIPDSEKGKYYGKIFPINHDPMSNDTLDQIRLFSEKMDRVKETNIMEFVNYCLSLVKKV